MKTIAQKLASKGLNVKSEEKNGKWVVSYRGNLAPMRDTELDGVTTVLQFHSECWELYIKYSYSVGGSDTRHEEIVVDGVMGRKATLIKTIGEVKELIGGAILAVDGRRLRTMEAYISLHGTAVWAKYVLL